MRFNKLLQQPDLNSDPKWLWFLSLYDEPEVWWLHQKELLSIYEGAKAAQIPLIVVVFPSMTDVEETRIVTDQVVNLFEDRKVPTIDVAELIKNIPTSELIASPVDSHPGELVHSLVAEALYDKFVELKLVKFTNQ